MNANQHELLETKPRKIISYATEETTTQLIVSLCSFIRVYSRPLAVKKQPRMNTDQRELLETKPRKIISYATEETTTQLMISLCSFISVYSRSLAV
ncbi:MAG: hypothetical protein R8L53_09955 [Mariprofundales bacterium]